ncbi:MAG: GatB/YqeY domain-containing protein [Dehalococcoidia bacterium]|nr:GatB/YqeY domain-containing protein [Dehalococcoidia bacterium]
MPLQEKLNTDLKAAMRARDELRMLVLRSLLSSMNYAEIARQKKLDDGGVIEVIGREIKQRKESIEAYEKGNRADLAAKEKAEMAILQEYMPAQMGREEILSIVKAVIAEVGAKGPGDKGKVMQKLMPQVKGKADGGEVNGIVTDLLGKL